MKRRMVISSTILAISFAGCLDNTENGDSEESSNDSARSNVDNNSSEEHENKDRRNEDKMKCSFYVEIVENPPKDATVVSAKEHQLMEINVIKNVFHRARDPDEDFSISKRRGGEFEYFIMEPDSYEKNKEAREALDSLPNFRSNDYPSGVYIEDGNITVAIAEDCVTE